MSRGRGGRRESTGRRRSQEEKTPRTQLKTDIRDLINSEYIYCTYIIIDEGESVSVLVIMFCTVEQPGI